MTNSFDGSTAESKRERWLLRSGALLAIVGALVTTVTQAIRPTPAVPGSIESYFTTLLDFGSFPWLLDNLGLLVGLMFVVGSFVTLSEILRFESWSTELGKATAIIGAGIVAVTALVSGVALPPLVETWAGADGSQAATAFGYAAGIWWITRAMFVGVVIVFFGITYLLMGHAVAGSDRYPGWFGYIAVVTGALSVLTGLLMAVEGQTQLYDYTVFPALALVSMIWVLVLGVLMWRQASTSVSTNPG